MRAILFLVGGVILANIVWATFVWRAPAREKAAPIVNSATMKGQEPWMANEHHIESARRNARRSVLGALDKPWASHCTAEGRKSLISAIEYYYEQRNGQLIGYAEMWGEAGGRYIVKAWAAPDDNRIERMIRETYGRGYFALEDLRPWIRKAVAGVVKGERVTAAPCRA
jgi:hypothetical protein